MTLTGRFSMQQVLAGCVGPLALCPPSLSVTPLCSEPEADQPAHRSAPGGGVNYSRDGGKTKKTTKNAGKENDSWKQLEIIPHSAEQLQWAFCPGSPPWKCLLWNRYLCRDRREQFHACGTTLAASNSAVICIFIWCYSQGEHFQWTLKQITLMLSEQTECCFSYCI